MCESMCQRQRVSDDACKYLCVGDIFSFVMEDFLRLRSHDDRLMSKASGCFFEAFTQGWLKTNWMDIIIVLLIMNFCLSDALNEKTTFGQKRIALPALFISFHVLAARDGGRWHQLVNVTVAIRVFQIMREPF